MAECDVQMGRTLLSVQLASMLPCGQPEPPEITFVILKAGGAVYCGAPSVTAANASEDSVYFIAGVVKG